MSTAPLSKRIVAETLGTFLLVFIGAGTAAAGGILLRVLQQPSVEVDLLLVALAHGLGLFIIVMIVGRVSGAHVNPALTLGLAASKRFDWADVPGYLAGQFVGAILGALAILVVLGRAGATIGHLGAPSLGVGVGMWQGLVIEGIGTGILMLAVMATAVDTRAIAGWAGLTIGLALGAIIMVIGVATGGAVNPARAFGPDLVDVFFGVPINWIAYVVTYLIGPILGATGAAFLYVYFSSLPAVVRQPEHAELPTSGR